MNQALDCISVIIKDQKSVGSVTWGGEEGGGSLASATAAAPHYTYTIYLTKQRSNFRNHWPDRDIALMRLILYTVIIIKHIY